jgi:hypothetical protein
MPDKKTPPDIMDIINYVKLISPPEERGVTPWFTFVDESLKELNQAVRRLELVVHHHMASKDVGGSLLAGGSLPLDNEAAAIRNPPPPPPNPHWHSHQHVDPPVLIPQHVPVK